MCPIINGCGDTAAWNVTHKKPYRSYEWKTNDLSIEVYKGKVNTRDELVARIVNSATHIKQEHQDDLRRATSTFAKRVEKCIEVDGGIFEHLLWTVATYWDHLHNQ